MGKAEKFKEPGILLEPDFIQPSQGLKNISLSFLGGCLAGVANVLIGHPLATLKVRMQMLNLRLFECGRLMLHQEGLSSFYKGIASPLCNVPLIYAICLGSYEVGRWAQGVGFHDQMNVYQGAIAGGWAGMTSCVLVTPMELVKCKLQMEVLPHGNKTTATQMTRIIVKSQGASALFKGNLITIVTEVPGSAAYFAIYEFVKTHMNAKYGSTHFTPLIAGGLAGLLSWGVSYPQDVIKTKLQCDLGPSKQYVSHKWIRDGGIINCAKDIWRTEGMKGFCKGFSACGLRSIISEAFSFLVYENARKHLIKSGDNYV